MDAWLRVDDFSTATKVQPEGAVDSLNLVPYQYIASKYTDLSVFIREFDYKYA